MTKLNHFYLALVAPCQKTLMTRANKKLVNSLFVNGDYELRRDRVRWTASAWWPFFSLHRHLVFKGSAKDAIANWKQTAMKTNGICKRMRFYHATRSSQAHSIFIFHLQLMEIFLKLFTSEISHALYFYESDGGRSLNIFWAAKNRPQEARISRSLAEVTAASCKSTPIIRLWNCFAKKFLGLWAKRKQK